MPYFVLVIMPAIATAVVFFLQKFYHRAFICKTIRIIFIIFFGITALKSRAQIDTIFKYNSSHERVAELWKVYVLQLQNSPDSAKVYKQLDTIVEWGNKKDPELALTALYLKLDNRVYKSSNTKKIIVDLYALKKWVDECPVELVKATFTFGLGQSLYWAKQYPEAFNFLLQAHSKYEQIGLGNVPPVLLDYLAYFAGDCYSFGDYENTVKYARLYENHPGSSTRLTISAINTGGMAYLNLNNLEQAKMSFLDAISAAKRYRDTPWIGIASGNYGNTLMKENKYADAIAYLTTDYNINNVGEPKSAVITALRLSECYVKNGDLQKAKFYIGESMRLKKVNPDSNFIRSYYKSLLNYYNAIGNTPLATKYADSFVTINEILNANFASNVILSTQKRVQTEAYLKDLALAEEKQKDSLARKNIIIIAVSIILCMALVMLYNRYRSAQKDKKLSIQQKQLLQLDKEATEERLRHAEEELNSYLKGIAEKNELAMKANEGLQELQSNLNDAAASKKLETLSTLFQFTILTEQDWRKFKQMFDTVHPFFFTNLKNQFPSFTQAELRLLALLKLGLSNKEMASVIGISPDSITRSKYRLRKRLEELNIEKELEQFVKEF